MRSHKLLATSAALAWMLLAQPALGATVSATTSHGETRIVYEAAVGELNYVSIVEEPHGVLKITDLNAAITPQSTGCISISPNAVRCEIGPEGVDVRVFTKDGADGVDAGSDAFVFGGAGPDMLSGDGALFGGRGEDTLVGRRGNQWLVGGRGADSLDGGPGDDELQGGAGTDVIAGGAGLDIVSYVDHSAPVKITFDGRANDGAAGEHDWVQADVEAVYSASGPTTFIGNAGPNDFYGGNERDVVRTGAGDDFVFGEGGQDVVLGGAGDDSVDGGYGRDVLSGGPGSDELIGYQGADVIRGGRGNDFLNGQSGTDDLGGGRGIDRLSGGPDNDMLQGGPGDDRLFGDNGADLIYARDRNRDRVGGGPGHDLAQVDAIDRLFRVEVLF